MKTERIIGNPITIRAGLMAHAEIMAHATTAKVTGHFQAGAECKN